MSAADTAGFFTLGVPPEPWHLPHPRLGLPVVLLIRRVLLRAFELLREQGYPVATANEDPVTKELRSIIENRLRQSMRLYILTSREYFKTEPLTISI